MHLPLLKVARSANIFSRHILQSQGTEATGLSLEVLESWVAVDHISRTKRVLSGEDSALEGGLVKLELVL